MTDTTNEQRRMVFELGKYMLAAFSANAYKNEMLMPSIDELCQRAYDELMELVEAVTSGESTHEDVWDAAADVANFAALIANEWCKAKQSGQMPGM